MGSENYSSCANGISVIPFSKFEFVTQLLGLLEIPSEDKAGIATLSSVQQNKKLLSSKPDAVSLDGKLQAVIHKRQLKYLANYLESIGTETVVVEHSYIDEDLHTDQWAYWTDDTNTSQYNWSRLHFFSKHKNEATTGSNIGGKELLQVSDWVKSAKSVYVGYMVTILGSSKFIGSTCLKVKDYNNSSSNKNIEVCRNYSVNLLGHTLEVESLGFIEQDPAVSACATCAIWSSMQKSSAEYKHDRLTPAQITAGALGVEISHARLPYEKGLSQKEISRILDSIPQLNTDVSLLKIQKEPAMSGLINFLKDIEECSKTTNSLEKETADKFLKLVAKSAHMLDEACKKEACALLVESKLAVDALEATYMVAKYERIYEFIFERAARNQQNRANKAYETWHRMLIRNANKQSAENACEIYNKMQDSMKLHLTLDKVLPILDSGIPIILTIGRELEPTESKPLWHAICLTGYIYTKNKNDYEKNLSNLNQLVTEVIGSQLSNIRTRGKRTTTLIAHDDNIGPFVEYEIKENGKIKTLWSDKEWTVIAAICPIHSSIRVYPYANILRHIKKFCRSGRIKAESEWLFKIWKCSRYKADLAKKIQNINDEKTKLEIIKLAAMNLPKFIYVARNSSEEIDIVFSLAGPWKHKVVKHIPLSASAYQRLNELNKL